MAPDIESIVSTTPELHLNGVRQVISLIIEVDRPISIINLFPITQVYHAKIVRVLHWIIVKAKPEPQNVNIAGAVFRNIIQYGLQWYCPQGDLFQTLS